MCTPRRVAPAPRRRVKVVLFAKNLKTILDQMLMHFKKTLYEFQLIGLSLNLKIVKIKYTT